MQMTGAEHGPRVAVVGAGMIGAAIAFNLAARGLRPIVYDTASPGGGASAVSFSWINGSDKAPRGYSDLSRRCLEAWDRFSRRLGGDAGVSWGGELRWAATEAGAAALRRRVLGHAAQGYPMRSIDRAEFRRLEPTVEPGEMAGASFSEAEGHVETEKAIEACLREAARRGADVRANTSVTGFEVTSPERAARSVQAVCTEAAEPEPCDVVVLAAGARTPDLAAKLGLRLPIKTTFGATLLTEPVEPLFRSVSVLQTARDGDVRVSIRQLADGRVMMHGLGRGEGSLGRTDDEIDLVMKTGKACLPALKAAKLAEVRRGDRPVPEDGMPVWGFADSVPNVYVATMHNAITLAPLIGELSAMEIVDGARIDEIEAYRISRFN